jgi:hypothetical protein
MLLIVRGEYEEGRRRDRSKARLLIQQHGDHATAFAIDALNQCIDRQDWGGRDYWARLVHRLHELSPG